jgi:hypothetical protein
MDPHYAVPEAPESTSREVVERTLTDASRASHVAGVVRHLQGKGVAAKPEDIRRYLIERAERFEAQPCEIQQTDAQGFECLEHGLPAEQEDLGSIHCEKGQE